MPRTPKAGPPRLKIMERMPSGAVNHLKEKIVREGVSTRELSERTNGRIGHARINRILDADNTEIDGEDYRTICEAMKWNPLHIKAADDAKETR